MRLVVDAVRFAYPGRPDVLDGVHMDVSAGESVAVVGPSGSGKTTFLALLGGLLQPLAGRIHLETPHGTVNRTAAHVSWVLQTVNVLSDRSVLDNVALGAFSDGLDRTTANDHAVRAIDRVGLGEMSSWPVRTLSGGEAQRAAIARAVISERPVLLADEPTGQLDEHTSRHVVDTLLRSAEDKITVIVTHDNSVAARCSRVVRLSGRRLS